MHVYRILDIGRPADYVDLNTYAGTLGEAHAKAKDVTNFDKTTLRVELIDVDTSKDSLIGLLNAPKSVEALAPLRTWALTKRGGLAPCPNGE